MTSTCTKCKQPVNGKSVGLECGFCSRVSHLKCVNLTKQKLEYIKSNGLFWKCDSCKNATGDDGAITTVQSRESPNVTIENNHGSDNCSGCKLIPFLLDSIQKLNDTVNKLQEKINIMPANSSRENTNDPEEIINEISERQKRAKNIIIYKLEESNNDTAKTKEIINMIAPDVDTSNIKLLRLGNPNNNNIRPLKVTLNNPEESAKIIYNKKKLKQNNTYNVQLTFDLTNIQRSYLKTVVDEMENRKNNGENLYIKYVNGKPTIAKVSNPKN